MFSHATKYNWRLHGDRLRSTLLGAARRNLHHLRASEEDEVIRSAETEREIRAYLQARTAGDPAAEATTLNNVVRKWDADNAAGGVGIHARLPLPTSFAAELARQFGDATGAEQDPMFDDLIKKFDPSVRTLVAQQIGAQMSRLLSPERDRRAPQEVVSPGGDNQFGSRETLGGVFAELSPWLQSRLGLRESLDTPGLMLGDDEERRSRPSVVQPFMSQAERDGRLGSHAMEHGPADAPMYQRLAGHRPREREDEWNTSTAPQRETPYDPKIDDVAKDLQYYGYDPAQLSKNMPGWRPILLFDDRLPEGYHPGHAQGGMIRRNSKGFGGYLAHRKGSRDFAFMVKGVEISEGRWNDVTANDYAGADQVAEVAEDVFQQCKALGVFDAIKKGGSLTIVGHSQGAPSAQLLGVYVIVRALNEKPPLLTEAEALAAIRVRGFGGIGARDYLDRLRGPDGKPLEVPPSVLDRINAVTYIVSGDPLAQRYSGSYIGSAYIVDRPDPGSYTPNEPWARGEGNPLAPHARSAYKAADYRTARRHKPPTLRDKIGDTIGGAADAFGGIVDRVTDWWY